MILVGEGVKELALSFDKCYIANGRYNSPGVSRPFENSPPKDVFLYDGIGEQNTLFVEGTSREGKKKNV